jgi:hypothetical protein
MFSVIKTIFSILVSLSIGICMYKYINMSNFEDNYSNILTYLSIIIGFVITSVTIIGTSQYSRILYEKQDPSDNSKTLLHNLIDSFKFTLIFYFIPMLLIILDTVIPWKKPSIIMYKSYSITIFLFTIWTFPILFIQFKKMLKFILQNAKGYR